jgi:hypothetical protein
MKQEHHNWYVLEYQMHCWYLSAIKLKAQEIVLSIEKIIVHLEFVTVKALLIVLFAQPPITNGKAVMQTQIECKICQPAYWLITK